MNVAFYTPNYPSLTAEGGIGSYTRALGYGLAALGHKVHVLTPGDRPSVADGPVHVHFTKASHILGLDRLVPGMGACWRVGQAMRALVRQYCLDVVEFPNWEGYGLVFQRLTRTPMAVRLHTSSKETQVIDGTPPTRWQRWDVRREKCFARSADALVTHSDAHRRLMVDELDISPERIKLIPHGVDVFPDWVRPTRPSGPSTVVYLGRLEHRKGTFELLQAIPEVLKRVPDARFVLIGADRAHCPSGLTHAKYLEREFSPEVRRCVTLAGRLPQPEVDRWLQTADLFVAPSRYESFGLVFLEAMRWGTPVVGTTAGGIPEIVENGKSGVLVRPESPSELAVAIAELLLDHPRRAALGSTGRLRVEAEFSVQRMSERVAGFYKEVVRTHGKRREVEHAV